MTVNDVIEKLGRQELMEALGVTTSAISNAKEAQLFPGHWYGPMSDLAQKGGWLLPTTLFSWKKPRTAA